MKLLVSICYRSPSSSEENNRELAELISKALNKPHITHILIFGDFNYPNIDWEHMNADLDKESELFYDNLNENLLVQHINVITRHKLGNSPSRLDLIFTNEEDMVEDIKCLAPLGKRDHIGLSFKLVTTAIMKIKEHEANMLKYHTADYNKINLVFKMTQWDILFKLQPLQNMWRMFSTN